MKPLSRIILVLAAALCLPHSFAQTAQRPEWIDVHMHLIGGAGQRGDIAGAAWAAVEAMNEAGIRIAVVMPPPQTVEMRNRQDIDDFRSALKAHPGRFAFLGGGGSLNVMIHQNSSGAEPDARARAAFEQTARDILAAGAAGFGEIAAHHLSHARGHPYEWTPPDQPLLLLLADIAAENDAVIDLHLDLVIADMSAPARPESHNPPLLKENFAAFERLLAHNRRAKIVWAHAGSDPLGKWTPDLSRELLARHPNLYMSLRFPARTAGMPGGEGPAAARGRMGTMGQTGMGEGNRPFAPGTDEPAAVVRPSLAFDFAGNINPAWLRLVQDFPDRFVLGGDQFIAGPQVAGTGPGVSFSRLSPIQRELQRRFLSALPADVARKIAIDNPARLYKLDAGK